VEKKDCKVGMNVRFSTYSKRSGVTDFIGVVEKVNRTRAKVAVDTGECWSIDLRSLEDDAEERARLDAIAILDRLYAERQSKGVMP
jgi:hypothetical protein